MAENHGGKKNRKYGRNISKCQQYCGMHTREKNKIKRVLQSNGIEAATSYAEQHNLRNYLNSLLS